MTLDNVVVKIREEGTKAAASVKAQAQKDADALAADAERRAAAVKAKRAAELVQAIESLKRREVASAELDAKKVRLNAQKDVLAKVREEVFARLAKLDTAKRVQHIQALAKASTIPNGKLLVAQRDFEAAKKAGLDVAGVTEALGGVVVVAPDETTREDLRYETIFDDVWRENLKDVAETLFGKV
ncbi:MAG: V-type ATP synthase subunit E family protein [Thermoplasmatota archaeon]